MDYRNDNSFQSFSENLESFVFRMIVHFSFSFVTEDRSVKSLVK